MSVLDIDNLTKIFGDDEEGEIIAVNDLDITVDDGEFLVLVGPSGCGKSTTLRCVAGLETPTSGDIRVGGEVITDQKPKNRDIAMVFQNYALYPHMTARENMAFGLKMTTEMDPDEIDRVVEEVASMMDIGELLDKRPAELSGGQQQRVALGRAIVRDPEVFLLDEPLSNLDAKLRSQMRTELQNLQQEVDVTTIYVTHDQTEAMTMGDRIAVLNDGELQQIGTPLECYHEPANRFVAGFIGSPSMNFLQVELVDDTDHPRLEHAEFSYQLSDPFYAELDAPPSDLVLGIRPEHIQLADGDEQNAITASVNVIEPLGDLTYVYMPLGEKTLTASLIGDVQIPEHTDVDIVFPEDRLHLFDRTTGEALKHPDVALEDTTVEEPTYSQGAVD